MTIATNPPRRFPIRIGRRSRLLLRIVFGASAQNSYVDVGERLEARFGWSHIETPIANISRWQIEGPWLWLTAIGVRRGIRRGDITFGGNHRGGVRLDFHEPVRFFFFNPPTLYLSVADLEGLAEVLSAAGIPGEDVRRSQ